MDDLILGYTVIPISDFSFTLDVEHLSDHSHPRGKPASILNSVKLKGFCLNKYCSHPLNKIEYKLGAAHTIFKQRYVSITRGQVTCKLCDHALFWTRGWKEHNAPPDKKDARF